MFHDGNSGNKPRYRISHFPEVQQTVSEWVSGRICSGVTEERGYVWHRVSSFVLLRAECTGSSNKFSLLQTLIFNTYDEGVAGNSQVYLILLTASPHNSYYLDRWSQQNVLTSDEMEWVEWATDGHATEGSLGGKMKHRWYVLFSICPAWRGFSDYFKVWVEINALIVYREVIYRKRGWNWKSNILAMWRSLLWDAVSNDNKSNGPL